jgi:long-chain fatty acid transport protein
MDLGVAVFSPDRSYSATGSAGVTDGTNCGANCPFEIGPQSITSDNDYFLIPHFARNWMLDDNRALGLTVYGNGGMNTEYTGGTAQHNNGSGFAVTTAGTFGGGTAGVNLEQLFLALTYAQKFSDTASWGVTPVLAYQRFKAEGLSMFAGYSTDSSHVTNQGTSTSTGYGLKLGVQGDVSPGVTLAASYQTKMSMSKFDEYAGLFAEQGSFDIPATATLGLAWQTSPGRVFTADVQTIYYGDVDAIANPIAGLLSGCATSSDLTQCLGGANGAGFGWDDMTILKLGYQWAGSPGWTWRVGASYAEQPIPSSEVMFNILAPGVMQTHLTFGFTRETAPDREFNFAAMYAPEASVSGTNPLDPAQTIELKMNQWELEGSWAWKF